MKLEGISIQSLAARLQRIPAFSGLQPVDILKNIKFFSGLDSAILKSIAESITIHEFKAGETVCRHGMFDERFYIILTGSVKAVVPAESNPRCEVYRLGEGDFFGEEVAFSSEPRENSIITVEDMTALSMDEVVLKRLMNVSGTIKDFMDMKYIARKLHRDLRMVPLFTRLNENVFQEILNQVKLITLPEKEIIVRYGDPGDAFYLIRDGEVQVYMPHDNEERLIAILGEGQFFGEMSLLSDDPRNATVETSKKTDLVMITREVFTGTIKKDRGLMKELQQVADDRKEHHADLLKNPDLAYITRILLDLNRDVNRHLDILSQCAIDTSHGSALLATLPGSRYPYVYPRDSACASRFLYRLAMSPLRSGDLAFRLLGEIARFILNCQRDDGYWGQRYGIDTGDKGIYMQEDNVAHGVCILCRYLLAAHGKGVSVPEAERFIDAIARGAAFARKNYYRNEIHLFYSTTSIHESAIEQGYSIWVNYAYLLMLRLIEGLCRKYGVMDQFPAEMNLKSGFEKTIENVFSISGRHVRRLKPDGEVDLRPDITLMSPFFFGTGMEEEYFSESELFSGSIEFVRDTLWDPDLGMLQRYLPFIEDPDTHIHAGNGPWLQYTAMLAQYYYHTGNLEEGDAILEQIDRYSSKEGYLCEHLTTPERFREFKRFEWVPGRDYEKEFDPGILIPDMPYDNIVEELNHMKNSYDEVERQSREVGDDGYISFATPLMWSHAEYAMALMMRTDCRLRDYAGYDNIL